MADAALGLEIVQESAQSGTVRLRERDDIADPHIADTGIIDRADPTWKQDADRLAWASGVLNREDASFTQLDWEDAGILFAELRHLGWWK